MKVIDIIRPGSINAIIGPVGTLKRMLGDRDYFVQRGYDISVFSDESLQSGGIKFPPSDEQVRNTFKTTTLLWKVRHSVGSFIRNHARDNNLFAIFLMEKTRKKVKQLVDYYISLNRNADVVQFHSNQEAFFYLKNRKDKRAKTIMFLHTDGYPYKMLLQYYPKLKNTRYFKRYMEDFEWTVENVDHICFIAKIGQKNFLSLFPKRTLKDTSVILNGINDYSSEQKETIERIKRDRLSNFKYRLCCTGTINNRKGHKFIIEALHELSKDLLEQVHVDFLGDGAERHSLEELTEKYGLSANITFHGIIPNVDVYKYLVENNIYILMSKNEGLPISIIEAMRASLMIIATNISGIPELVEDGYNGYLLDPDTQSLVNVLKKLPTYNIETMGRNSRSRYEREFTFSRMESEFCDLYDGFFKFSV